MDPPLPSKFYLALALYLLHTKPPSLSISEYVHSLRAHTTTTTTVATTPSITTQSCILETAVPWRTRYFDEVKKTLSLQARISELETSHVRQLTFPGRVCHPKPKPKRQRSLVLEFSPWIWDICPLLFRLQLPKDLVDAMRVLFNTCGEDDADMRGMAGRVLVERLPQLLAEVEGCEQVVAKALGRMRVDEVVEVMVRIVGEEVSNTTKKILQGDRKGKDRRVAMVAFVAEMWNEREEVRGAFAGAFLGKVIMGAQGGGGKKSEEGEEALEWCIREESGWYWIKVAEGIVQDVKRGTTVGMGLKEVKGLALAGAAKDMEMVVGEGWGGIEGSAFWRRMGEVLAAVMQ